MAKPETKTSQNQPASKRAEDDVITLDIQPFITPLAIIIGAIMISVSILIGTNNIDGVSSSNSNNGAVTPTTAAEEFPAATAKLDDDPIMGDKSKAKVAIVEFSDYECPFCKRHYEQTHEQLVKNYIDTGKAVLTFRDFPLSFHDPLATKQAMAAECVDELGDDKKYFEYHDLIFKNTSSNGNGLAETRLHDFAKEVGVDAGKFKDCYEDERFKDEVAKDLADGQAAGVSGTPGFIIGILNEDGTVTGKMISGAYPYSTFEQILNEYLQ